MNSFDLKGAVAAGHPLAASALQHFQAPYTVIEAFSSGCALLGSLLLALKGRNAGIGWLLFAWTILAG